MPRKSTVNKELEAILSEISFTPGEEHTKLKTAFWASVEDNPLYSDHTTIRAADIAYVTGQGAVNKWWSIDGFPEWFLNTDEFKQKRAYIAHQALNRLSDILESEETKDSALVAAVKLALELDNRMPTKNEIKFADAQIGQMDVKQLEEFISKRTHTVTIGDEPNGEESEETPTDDDHGDSFRD